MNKQFHIQCQKGELGRYVLLPGDPGRCEIIAGFLENSSFIAKNREFVSYNGYIGGVKVGVLSTGIGGPSAAIAVEEAVMAGADTFIRIGTAGGINMDVKGGDVVIPLSAVRQEGTSLHYAPSEYPATANFDIIDALKESAGELGYSYHIGVIHSKDSFYGQHSPERMPVSYELINKWEAYKKLGVLCSEMECAAVFTVAAALNVRAGAVLNIIWNQERKKAGLLDENEFDTLKGIKTAVNAIKKLISND